MRRIVALVLAICLVGVAVPRVEAAYSQENAEAALYRMLGLRILRGHWPGDPAATLGDRITRAELVTLMVRAFGREKDEELLRGAPVFPDTADHWASGYIAQAVQLAAEKGSTIGMPDGAFHPDETVTPAQIIAFIMKFLGVRPMPLKEWPAGYLDVAAEQRMIHPDDMAWVRAEAQRPATRGEAFYLMDWTFYHYDVGAGMTFYTTYVDPTPPKLELNPIVPESGSGKLTITGRVEGATEVYVDNRPATVLNTGEFTYEYDVGGKLEYAITVTARDLAGHTVEASIGTTRCAAVSCRD